MDVCGVTMTDARGEMIDGECGGTVSVYAVDIGRAGMAEGSYCAYCVEKRPSLYGAEKPPSLLLYCVENRPSLTVYCVENRPSFTTAAATDGTGGAAGAGWCFSAIIANAKPDKETGQLGWPCTQRVGGNAAAALGDNAPESTASRVKPR